MNYYCLFAALLAGSFAAQAAPPMPAPQTCQIAGSQNDINYGVHSRGELEISGRNRLSPGPRSLQVSVICRYPQPMRLTVSGAGRGSDFRWGETGMLRVRVHDAKLDGEAIDLSTPGGKSGAAALTLHPGTLFMPDGETAGRQLTFIMTLNPEIDGASGQLNSKLDFNAAIKVSFTS